MEVRQAYRVALDSSHHGTHHPVSYLRTGQRGRPRAIIDREWLEFAIAHRTTSAIARFLNLSRDTVRLALLEYGLAEPQEYPFTVEEREDSPSRSALDEEPPPHSQDSPPPPNIPPQSSPFAHTNPLPSQRPDHTPSPSPSLPLHSDDTVPQLEPIHMPINGRVYRQRHSYTGPVSTWSDDDLDDAIRQIRLHHPNAGLAMIHGSLRALGQNVPQARIRRSLFRIDPVRRVFERHQIQRRVYSVPGPNSLWHHDGQHGELPLPFRALKCSL